MRRSRRISWGAAAVAGLFSSLIAGCTTAGSPPWEAPPRQTFGDTFYPKEPAATYDPVMQPRFSAGLGGDDHWVKGKGQTNKHFDFRGVRQDKRTMAAALEQVQADMLARVRASGAEVRGEVRTTREGGVLRQFEFDYRHHRAGGLVRGWIRPSERDPGWDLKCTVAEDVPPR